MPARPAHRTLALAALAAGQAILVEKSFTVTPAATRGVVAPAGAAGRSASLFASLRSPAP